MVQRTVFWTNVSWNRFEWSVNTKLGFKSHLIFDWILNFWFVADSFDVRTACEFRFSNCKGSLRQSQKSPCATMAGNRSPNNTNSYANSQTKSDVIITRATGTVNKIVNYANSALSGLMVCLAEDYKTALWSAWLWVWFEIQIEI